jgi:hypothetical protein
MKKIDIGFNELIINIYINIIYVNWKHKSAEKPINIRDLLKLLSSILYVKNS